MHACMMGDVAQLFETMRFTHSFMHDDVAFDTFAMSSSF